MKYRKRTNVRKEKIMTTLMLIQTVLELLAVAFIFWGIFNEQKLVAFERRIVRALRRRNFKVIRSAGGCNKQSA
ncbi:MAG: hypothetical protein IJP26_00655 [Clostridia bacterium]|nr:hypothetical protein [Clostridia bacterium]